VRALDFEHVSVPAMDTPLAQAVVMSRPRPDQQTQRVTLYQQVEQQYLNAVAFCPLW
jgi:hypothetical protein